MAYVSPKGRVLQRSLTASTGPYALETQTDTSLVPFSKSMSVGDTTTGYVAEPGVAFAEGTLTYSATNEITLTTTIDSNGTFGSGTKEIGMGPLPSKWGNLFDSTGVADQIRHNTVQSLTATQQAQARANAYAAPFDALAYNGMQINGGVDISQELGTTGATLASGTAKYIADMWLAHYTHGAGTAVVTSQQIAAASFPGSPPGGYSFGHQIKATTAITSPANGDFALHRFMFEGYRIARLAWGTANAQPLAYCFQFYSTASGVAAVKFANNGKSRVYFKEVTVAAGWNFFSGTIPGDTTGTWLSTTGIGLQIEIFVAGKSASPAAPGSWGSTDNAQTTNSTNLLGTNNNLTIATGFFIFPGLEFPSAERAAFLLRPAPLEKKDCRRFYWKKTGEQPAIYDDIAAGSSGIGQSFVHPEEMATTPTINLTGGGSWTYQNCQTIAATSITTEGYTLTATSTGVGVGFAKPGTGTITADSRLV